MEAREALAALLAAERDLAHAGRLRSAATQDGELAAHRLVIATRRRDRAVFALTQGRPLYEVVWSLPDEL